LLAGGVPARRITVAGFSKGGVIAMIAAGMIRNRGVGYVIMAGCAKPGHRAHRIFGMMRRRWGNGLTGQVLSIYDSADRDFTSCRQLQNISTNLRFHEIVARTGQGHGLFYTPDARWLARVARWSKQRRR
jgi:hypothetical protein